MGIAGLDPGRGIGREQGEDTEAEAAVLRRSGARGRATLRPRIKTTNKRCNERKVAAGHEQLRDLERTRSGGLVEGSRDFVTVRPPFLVGAVGMLMFVPRMVLQVLVYGILTVKREREQGLESRQLSPYRDEHDHRNQRQCSFSSRHSAPRGWISIPL